MVLCRFKVVERWSDSVCIFFTGCGPESDTDVWLYHTVEEKDYEPQLNKSNIDAFPLAEEDSLHKIIQGYTLKMHWQIQRDLHLKQRQYIVS